MVTYSKKDLSVPSFLECDTPWGLVTEGDLVYAQDWGCWCYVSSVQQLAPLLTSQGNVYSRLFIMRKMAGPHFVSIQPELYKATNVKMTRKRSTFE